MKIYTTYDKIQNELEPGDVIAFIGNNKFCNLIKAMQDYLISHVGIIIRVNKDIENPHKTTNLIIESGMIHNFDGVSINDFSQRIHEYIGEVFVLKLNKNIRKNFHSDVFYNWLHNQEGKQYDINQCLSLGLKDNSFLDINKYYINYDILNNTSNKEDYSKLFCSELVSGGLKAANILPNINPSLVTPKDICSYKIYDNIYYQIKGNPLFDLGDVFNKKKI